MRAVMNSVTEDGAGKAMMSMWVLTRQSLGPRAEEDTDQLEAGVWRAHGGLTVDEREYGGRGGEVGGETEIRMLGGHDREEAAANGGLVGERAVAVGAGGVGHCGRGVYTVPAGGGAGEAGAGIYGRGYTTVSQGAVTDAGRRCGPQNPRRSGDARPRG